METTKPKRAKPSRTTVDLGAWVRPEVKQRAVEEAQRRSLSVSEYVAALIRAEAPRERPAAGLSDLALAGHRVVAALDEARERGETSSVECLTALRAEIVRALLLLRPSYDALVDLGDESRDDWSGR
ncbi:MAG: hypothetical protein ACYDDQ_01730 [Vulcanimicrobiaceae bacterium]